MSLSLTFLRTMALVALFTQQALFCAAATPEPKTSDQAAVTSQNSQNGPDTDEKESAESTSDSDLDSSNSLLEPLAFKQKMNNYLLESARYNNVKVAQLALQGNADVDIQDENGRTPLAHAARNNHLDIMTTLLAHNANINLPSGPLDCAPLAYALMGDHVPAVQLLLNNKADVNTIDVNGESPLTYAYIPELIHLLLDYNARVESQNVDMCKALVLQLLERSANNPHKQAIAKKVLDHHQSLFTPTDLLIFATMLHSPEIIELLIENGAHPGGLVDGKTALYRSFSTRNNPKTALLLKYLLPEDETNSVLSQLKENEQLDPQAYALPLSKSPTELFQLLVNQQQIGDCGIHALANAAAVEECIRRKKPVCSQFLKQYHPAHHSYITNLLHYIYPHRDITDGLTSLDIAPLTKYYFPNNNCCVFSFSSSRPPCFYTTQQSFEHLRWGVPDHTGPITHNKTLLDRIEKFKKAESGAEHIICHTYLASPHIPTDEKESPNHTMLVSLIKEHNIPHRPWMVYLESNNCPLKNQPDAQRLINFIQHHYASKLAE